MSPASFTWLRRIGSIFSITNQLFHNHSCQCKLSNTVLCTMKEMKMSLSNRCILFMYRSVTLFKHTSRYAYIIIFKTYIYIYIYAVETPHLQSIARTPGNCQAPRLSNSSRTRSPSAGSGSCALRRCPQTRCVIPVRRAHISPTEGLQWVHGYRYTMLYTHTYIQTYIRTYVYTHTYIRTYVQTDRQTYMHACICTSVSYIYIDILYIDDLWIWWILNQLVCHNRWCNFPL